MIAPAFPPAHQSVPESLANPSNATATRLTGRDYTSWSALSTFRSCPLRYKFRYIDGLPEEFVSAALVFGTGIHTAIEQHFQAILSGDRLPSTDQLMFAYRAAWLPYAPDAVRYASKDTRTSLDALACRMLKAFQRSSLSSVTGRVLGVEEELRGQLAEGMPDLLGRVDLLTEDDDRLLVTDIKTSPSRWSTEQVEDSGEQLLLYAKLAADIGPAKGRSSRATPAVLLIFKGIKHVQEELGVFLCLLEHGGFHVLSHGPAGHACCRCDHCMLVGSQPNLHLFFCGLSSIRLRWCGGFFRHGERLLNSRLREVVILTAALISPPPSSKGWGRLW